MIFTKKDKKNNEADNLLANFPSGSRYAESYRTLRTNLFFSMMENEIKSIVVTSSVQGEGKTNTAINLAHTIAQTDRRVLLMDCDLRRPHMTSLFSFKNDFGLTGLITETLGTRLTKGSLDKFSVEDLIQLTKLQKRTCCLSLENEKTLVDVLFEKGRMVDIYWKNRPDSKKLANTLIRENLLTEKEADLALGHQKKSVQRLGSILYSMGFVSEKDISKALSVHTIEAVKTISSMEHGSFVFSGISSDEIKQTINNKIDFGRLYSEFTSTRHDSYISRSIESAIKPTDTENLFLLPSGAVPPNPSELLGSSRTEFLLEYLKNRFDFIILDTPPVMPVTDALIMAPRTDGTLFVIKSGHTDRKIVHEMIAQYKKANQPILGAVLNRVDMQKEGYYRYYKKYYSSYYGK
ncbi:MAG: polysaccharide biosynthesis tyrosine autokinase [Desulfobacterium sp.]|nr:polysaccharide biosynthesis tyrosine autokinase [Desulfobacterium sp.]